MASTSKISVFQRLKIACLRAAVHWDALTANPSQYAQGLWWRITGKKLRSRMKLAPLLGQSRRAYDLWQALQPPLDQSLQNGTGVAILALIAAGDEDSITLTSCNSEGFEARVITNSSDLADIEWQLWDWILPIASGDTLAPGAGGAYRSAASRASGAQCVFYADDDVRNAKGKRSSPHLKPKWNAELFEHFDFLTGAALLRASTLHTRLENAADWRNTLTRHALEAGLQEGVAPVHLPHVLHHRQRRPSPVLPCTSSESNNDEARYPTVSLIVPTRNRLDLLKVCLKGLLQTRYPGKLDIIVIDNGSDDPATLEYLAALDESFARVVRDDGPFNFAALNNRAVEHTSGELLCFLNNDIEIRDPDWLTIMTRQAVREDVGAVGARLLYSDGTIQHAGVVTGIAGAAAHAHRRLKPEEEGYFHRHSLPQFVSAVTAACMMVSRQKFEAVGAFDAERFAVSFNDVDLCLRLREKGWENLYEPRATLVHHESVSRGLDQDPIGAARQALEVSALQDRWGTGFANGDGAPRSADPYHHPELSPLSEHFVLRL